ncbi:NADP oxidoreductase [Rufibacter radiotolerans]|uniref:NADP oxidoreductase n=1 Tax=Rufibacter radiotolerans TaxID=1379910 RepID=A0A0H4VLX4_9BACT|nr:NAD(P)-binding domain-containing protein [Rufibacter radiotolerans]AKQ44729.1 NADP oxidoreductase [Rufibacter radiotolerans]
MNISVLGTGSVGQALSVRLAGLGHQVFMGTRNVADSLQKTQPDNWGNPAIGTWAKEHTEVELLSFKEAVEKGNDLIVFALNGKAVFECLDAVGEAALNGKVLLDISNPLDFGQGFPPSLFVSNTDSLGEQIQNKYPGLKVVKTLNTMSNPVMVNPHILQGDHSVFVSGNDAEAKATATRLLNSFGWEDRNIIDLGDITTARGTEMVLPLWVRLYGKLQTPFFNFHVNTAKAQ